MNRRELLELLAVAVPALAGLSPDQRAVLEQGLSRSRGGGACSIRTSSTPSTSSPKSSFRPPTTPGAHAAGVAVFIEHIVADWYSEDDRAAFLAGLEDVDARSVRVSEVTFIEAPASEQMAVVEQLESSLAPGDTTGFWARFKALTLYGFYNSQPGIQQVLKTPFMPGFYDGDVAVADTRRRQGLMPPSYDAIVVGSGITGGWAAKELTERGLRTLVLEAGRPIDPATDYTMAVQPWQLPFLGKGNRLQTGAGPGHPAEVLRLRRVERAVLRERPGQSLHHDERDELRLDPGPPGGRPFDHLGTPGLSLERPRLRGEPAGWPRGGLADPLCRHRAVVRSGGAIHRRERNGGGTVAGTRRPVPPGNAAQRSGASGAGEPGARRMAGSAC